MWLITPIAVVHHAATATKNMAVGWKKSTAIMVEACLRRNRRQDEMRPPLSAVIWQ